MVAKIGTYHFQVTFLAGWWFRCSSGFSLDRNREAAGARVGVRPPRHTGHLGAPEPEGAPLVCVAAPGKTNTATLPGASRGREQRVSRPERRRRCAGATRGPLMKTRRARSAHGARLERTHRGTQVDGNELLGGADDSLFPVG